MHFTKIFVYLSQNFVLKPLRIFCLLTTAQLDRSTDISATNPSVCFNGLLYAEGTYVSLFNLVEQGNGGRLNNLESASKSA